MAAGHLYLIDGSGYIFRAYFALNRDRGARLTAPDGTPIGAVYVFNQMLVKLLKDVKANADIRIGMAFDTKTPTFRHKLYPDYKAHRPEPPDDLKPQFALIHELVAAWDIPVIVVPGLEADDIIATLTRKGREEGAQVTVVTGDKDLFQLVADGVEVYDPMRDLRYQAAEVKAKLGVMPEQVVDYLALVGDAVDNVPGVPKVGPKTAVELLDAYGSLDGVYKHLAEIKKPALHKTLSEHEADARLSLELVKLESHAEFAVDQNQLNYTPPKREKLEPLFKRLGFGDKTLANALTLAEGEAPVQVVQADAPPPAPAAEQTRIVTDLAALQALAKELEQARTIALHAATDEPSLHAKKLVGLALAWGEHSAYLPFSHYYLGAPVQLTLATCKEVLGPVLAKKPITASDAKSTRHALAQFDLSLGATADDVSLLSYVLDADRTSHGLEYLSRVFLRRELGAESELVGKARGAKIFAEVDVERASLFMGQRANAALLLAALLEEKLQPRERTLYRDLELPIADVLFAMESTGITIAPERLSDLASELQKRIGEVEKEITDIAGMEVNLNSPKQLAQLLFEKLNLPVLKKMKSGPSTDQSVLEQLTEMHPVPAKILEHRQLQKLLSTYVDALPKLADKEQRVHTWFNQAQAATGRLSSSDPNLQNIPIRSELGRRIRAAFVAPPQMRLVAADYSQIELRLLAHLSEDEALTEAFISGGDIHDRTAAKLFHVDEKAVTPEQRRRAKTLNFGLLYGLSPFRLAREENISMADAKAFIDAYFNAYPRVRGFMQKTIEDGRSKGYVETILGRRRHLPDLKSKAANMRQAAERIATNSPLQGSAADLVKLAMLAVQKRFASENPRARLLLQVHDELVVECPASEVEATQATLRQEMEGAYRLRVPLLVEVADGADWNMG